MIDLSYIVPLEAVDPLIDDHISFLKKYYAQKTFIASGAKVPREGGVILAVSDSKEKIKTLIKEDPFHQNNVARYTITEFNPTMTDPALGSMLSA
ncbi:YciI family protein [Kiloniella litopenaei]|uniref:YciI family protein n=1 Tax=Kiloniella litopenaei TaxID=1549748 RepID=UPI003BA862E7